MEQFLIIHNICGSTFMEIFGNHHAKAKSTLEERYGMGAHKTSP
jgi:hypothetical protein